MDFCLVGRVGFDAHGFHTGVHGLEARGGFFEPGGVEVREDEARAAFVDEGAGAAAADSRGAAGDEGDAVHDVWCHVGWFWLVLCYLVIIDVFLKINNGKQIRGSVHFPLFLLR